MSRPFCRRPRIYEKTSEKFLAAAAVTAICIALIFLAPPPDRQAACERNPYPCARCAGSSSVPAKGKTAGARLGLDSRHFPRAPDLYPQRWPGSVLHIWAVAAGDLGRPDP